MLKHNFPDYALCGIALQNHKPLEVDFELPGENRDTF